MLVVVQEGGGECKWEADDPVSLTSFFRSSEHKNAYENVLEEEGRVRSTPM